MVVLLKGLGLLPPVVFLEVQKVLLVLELV